MKYTTDFNRENSFTSRMRSVSCVVLLCICAVALFCGKDYDPFTDITNARAHVLSWSLAGKDSVPVYTTGTLEIGVALREKVDSFTIGATHNRFWPDTTVRAPTGEPYTFSVSFYDTGMETVSVMTHRVTNGTVTENIVIRSTLPLRQADVSGFFGDTLFLSTPPVSDKDVSYQWEFGPGRSVESTRDSASAVLESGIAAGTATLRVTDLSGGHASPCRPFSYTLNDTSHPVILCVNDSLRGDTLVTRDSVLAFKASIVNYRDQAADSCWVTGSAFDISYTQSHLYIKLFKDIATYTRQNGPLVITVGAIGNKQIPVTTRKTFWAVYDRAGVSGSDAVIDFVVPLKDSSSTAVHKCIVFGTAEDFRGDSMALRVTVNDSQYPTPCIIAGGSGTWEWPVVLDSNVNSITVTAFGVGPGNQQLTSHRVKVVYDSSLQDRVKPVIWGILADGKPAGGLFTPQANVALQVIAFDEGSGMQSLTINGLAAAPDSSGYSWRQTIGPLVHSLAGNIVTVSAIDRDLNEKDTAVTIFRNTPPTLDSGFAFPATLYIGNNYSFRIPCKDADGDPVSIVKTSSPAGMAVSSDGFVSWSPGVADAGLDTMIFQLYDGYQTAGPFSWTFASIDTLKPVVAVRFTTRENAFPALVQAGVDTLDVRLLTNNTNSAIRLLYSAAFTDRPQVLFSNDTSPLLIWAPGAADTGYRKLRVTVGNGSTVFDTINPAFRVVPRNHFPCSLSYTFTGDTTPTGELDLFSHASPETLFFAIHDSDDLSTEKYTVVISRNAVRSVAVVNKKDFTVVLRPDSASVLDTLLVSVSDMTGTSDSATFVIRNMSRLHARKLRLNTTAAGAAVAGNVLDFPVLVRLNTGNFNFSQAQSDGGDIRFSKPDGSFLPLEIERFDAQNGIAEIWVRIDTVYGNDSTQGFVMSWGTSPNPLGPADHNVFDTAKGFAGVWHMAGAPTDAVLDATLDHYDGVPTNLVAGASGEIGQCQRFNGTSSFVTMPGTAASKLNFPEQGIYSVSAWVNTAMLDGQFHTFASKGDNQYNLQIRSQSNEWQFSECMVTTGYTVVRSPASAGSWNLITGVRNGDRQYLYVNGVCTDSIIETTIGGTARSTASDFILGKMPESATYFFNGLIDEVRVSSIALSADWIKLCYMNQKAVDALVEFR
jgi:hypothetical protein